MLTPYTEHFDGAESVYGQLQRYLHIPLDLNCVEDQGFYRL